MHIEALSPSLEYLPVEQKLAVFIFSSGGPMNWELSPTRTKVRSCQYNQYNMKSISCQSKQTELFHNHLHVVLH